MLWLNPNRGLGRLQDKSQGSGSGKPLNNRAAPGWKWRLEERHGTDDRPDDTRAVSEPEAAVFGGARSVLGRQ